VEVVVVEAAAVSAAEAVAGVVSEVAVEASVVEDAVVALAAVAVVVSVAVVVAVAAALATVAAVVEVAAADAAATPHVQVQLADLKAPRPRSEDPRHSLSLTSTNFGLTHSPKAVHLLERRFRCNCIYYAHLFSRLIGYMLSGDDVSKQIHVIPLAPFFCHSHSYPTASSRRKLAPNSRKYDNLDCF
jgi:hypothetical protein